MAVLALLCAGCGSAGTDHAGHHGRHRSATSAPAADNPEGLSDAAMVGQLFMPVLYGSGAETVTPAQRAANLALYGEPTPLAVVERYQLGGMLLLDHLSLDLARPDLSTGNVDSAGQLRTLTAGLQAGAADAGLPPLAIAVDQEGGLVQRIADGVTALPSQRTMAAQGSDGLRCTYYRLGTQLRALGVTQDMAPVADVVRREGGVIGDRSFGPDPQVDAADVTAAVEGLQAAGVLATLKHWPGHGSTTTDSHAAVAVIRERRSTWEAVDRPPFAAAVGEAGAVMVGHLALPSVDPSGRPATFSPVLVRDLLRRDLGFDGVVVTDSLWMQPAKAFGDPATVALAALAAGEDVLLMPPDLPASYDGVLRAVRTRPDVRAEVQAAVTRILTAKQRFSRSAAAPAGCG